MSNPILWQPDESRVRNSKLYDFMSELKSKGIDTGSSYKDVHAWSVADPATFWSEAWDYLGVIGDKGTRALVNEGRMQDAGFFPDAKLSYAENLLRNRGDGVAMIFRSEDRLTRTLTHDDVWMAVAKLAEAMKNSGIKKGDRVAGYLPNMPETIIATLAASSIGAIWSSASPDFGVQGVLDRFGQIEPDILFCVDHYYYNGKTIDCLEKIKEIVPQLPTLKNVVVIPFDDVEASADFSAVHASCVRTSGF